MPGRTVACGFGHGAVQIIRAVVNRMRGSRSARRLSSRSAVDNRAAALYGLAATSFASSSAVKNKSDLRDSKKEARAATAASQN